MTFKKRSTPLTTRKSRTISPNEEPSEDQSKLKAIKTIQKVRQTHKSITAADTMNPIKPIVPKIQQDQLSKAFQNNKTANSKELEEWVASQLGSVSADDDQTRRNQAVARDAKEIAMLYEIPEDLKKTTASLEKISARHPTWTLGIAEFPLDVQGTTEE